MSSSRIRRLLNIPEARRVTVQNASCVPPAPAPQVHRIETWRDCPCIVHLHTDEIGGAVVVTFHSASAEGVLKFSAHPLLQPLTVDLSDADEFEFGVPEREVNGADSELIKQVADEIALARVTGKLVFSMTRLVDPLAGRLVAVPR